MRPTSLLLRVLGLGPTLLLATAGERLRPQANPVRPLAIGEALLLTPAPHRLRPQELLRRALPGLSTLLGPSTPDPPRPREALAMPPLLLSSTVALLHPPLEIAAPAGDTGLLVQLPRALAGGGGEAPSTRPLGDPLRLKAPPRAHPPPLFASPLLALLDPRLDRELRHREHRGLARRLRVGLSLAGQLLEMVLEPSLLLMEFEDLGGQLKARR